GLSLKAAHAAGIASERFGQHLQRHVALQLHVASAVHLTHAAGADRPGDFVAAEFCADSEGQSTTSLCLALSLVDSIPSVNLRSMDGEVSGVSDQAFRHMPGKPRNRRLASCHPGLNSLVRDIDYRSRWMQRPRPQEIFKCPSES